MMVKKEIFTKEQLRETLSTIIPVKVQNTTTPQNQHSLFQKISYAIKTNLRKFLIILNYNLKYMKTISNNYPNINKLINTSSHDFLDILSTNPQALESLDLPTLEKILSDKEITSQFPNKDLLEIILLDLDFAKESMLKLDKIPTKIPEPISNLPASDYITDAFSGKLIGIDTTDYNSHQKNSKENPLNLI